MGMPPCLSLVFVSIISEMSETNRPLSASLWLTGSLQSLVVRCSPILTVMWAVFIEFPPHSFQYFAICFASPLVGEPRSYITADHVFPSICLQSNSIFSTLKHLFCAFTRCDVCFGKVDVRYHWMLCDILALFLSVYAETTTAQRSWRFRHMCMTLKNEHLSGLVSDCGR